MVEPALLRLLPHRHGVAKAAVQVVKQKLAYIDSQSAHHGGNSREHGNVGEGYRCVGHRCLPINLSHSLFGFGSGERFGEVVHKWLNFSCGSEMGLGVPFWMAAGHATSR
jgi:hypothetical protein